MEDANMEELIRLLNRGVTPFHVVDACVERLEQAGFTGIAYDREWNLQAGGKYYVNHHGSALFAFTVGTEYRTGQMVRMAAAHTDYPTLRIKPAPDFKTKSYAQINVEVYGGPILNTWLDRPLGVAGRVAIKSADPFAPEMCYFESGRPILTIPNLAIHMNRDVNKGVELNPQTDMIPLLGLVDKEEADHDYFMEYLAGELSKQLGHPVQKDAILDYELYLYCTEEAQMVGIRSELLSSPRLDNLTSCHSLVSAMIESTRKDGINLIQLADHEEVGSTSKQGAASILLHDMLRRILRSLGASEDAIDAAAYDAMLVSADVAHAVHPNKVSKADPQVQPQMGKGLCIKQAASQSYATDAQTIAIFAGICEKANVPYQRFVNRSDMRGGSTLGAIASALTPVKTLDIGIPILAMHSARELMGAKDIESLTDAMKAYFSL
ncbi:M18 family aminopeptidase [Agathobacter ruminis]|uniref:M18 family aminopeptidase n=1 Tax=Agathobacter ruminis TaxID=1712665 RepID=A0A2G3E4N7_9FIRM|nr:M18 family aminopeptidase [Agathobacter ruminis]MDC7301398.1 M18 family aminopeptidase [Agathobacter ruminis]PHU38246.1 M18 family aminopeptidase [Agathobacter ruminis]